jgi:hypothetical protein
MSSNTGGPADDAAQPQPAASHLTDADRAHIATIVAAAFAQQAQQQPAAATVTAQPDVLRAEEVRLFNPDVEDSDLNAVIVTEGRYTIYKDVFTFTDRLSHIAAVRSEAKVRELFPTLLRGSALIWHSTELSEMERDHMRTCSIERLNMVSI